MSTQTLTVTTAINGQAVSGNGQFTIEGVRGLVGAYINPAIFGAGTTVAQAISRWEAITSRTLTAHRVYYGVNGSSNPMPTGPDNQLKADASAGRKSLISLRPPFASPTSSDAQAIDKFLAACKAAGVRAEVALWAEPNNPANQGMTETQFISAFRFYAPVVRASYPTVFCTSAYYVNHNNGNSWYPGDDVTDVIATDLYCSEYDGGDRLDNAASIADAAGKPFGVWEFNSSLNQTQAQATKFFGYLRSYFSARTAAGKPNADLALFNSGSLPNQETPITSSTDYRVPLYQSLCDAL